MPLSNSSSPTVSFPTSNTVSRSSVNANTASTLLVTANSAKKGATIWNNSTANLYIEFGAAPTTSAFAVKISADGYYELPFNYTELINGIWDAANGSALVKSLQFA